MKRSPVRAHVLVIAMVGVAVLSGGLVSPASAALGAADCPVPFPTEEAVDGVTGRGLTVERGTTADPFEATVLGRIDDGISSGVDMIIAELSSPAIDRAGGIWAGMSGSPVYAGDGRLIGAVSYSLAAGSPVAGITPAESMLSLVDESRTVQAGATSVRVVKPSTSLAQDIAATGEVTNAQARQGFQLLGVPVRGSVGDSLASRKVLERMQQGLPGTRLGAGGSSTKAAAADPAEIVPGSNYAAALSYGDVTFAGVGTTTFVCDGTAVAFGHPLLDNGGTRLSTHTASAVLVQKDPVFGSFKVANPGGVVGTVTRDARVGIAGPLGRAPATIPVTASFTAPDGTVRTGATQVVLEDVTPDVAAFQAVSTIEKAYGATASGTVRFDLSVRLRRADGSTTTVRRADALSARSAVTGYPVSYQVADEVYVTISQLLNQDLENIDILSVAMTGTTSTTFDSLSVRALEQRQSRLPTIAENAARRRGTVAPPSPLPQFRPLRTPVQVVAGTPLQVRVGMASLATGRLTRTTLLVPVPADAAGGFASLDLEAGQESFFFDGDQADTFTELLAEVRNRPGRASITATLTYETADGDLGQRSVTRSLQAPAAQLSRSYEVVVS